MYHGNWDKFMHHGNTISIRLRILPPKPTKVFLFNFDGQYQLHDTPLFGEPENIVCISDFVSKVLH
jgi:hypothetical protein